ncbi:unnamed protein product [Closterium sp. Naga37s-1]|nr:unnamed protein product [Closterium sp. Naga37s-1]
MPGQRPIHPAQHHHGCAATSPWVCCNITMGVLQHHHGCAATSPWVCCNITVAPAPAHPPYPAFLSPQPPIYLQTSTSVLPLALQRLCQASALSTLHNITVGVLWHLRPHTPPPASREAATATETPPPVPFSALLVPPQGVAVRVSLPAGVVAEGKRLQVQQGDGTEDFGIAPVKRKCGEREEEEWSPLMLPMEVYVPRSLARAMSTQKQEEAFESTRKQDEWSPLMLLMEVYAPCSLARAMASTGPCRLYDETMRHPPAHAGAAAGSNHPFILYSVCVRVSPFLPPGIHRPMPALQPAATIPLYSTMCVCVSPLSSLQASTGPCRLYDETMRCYQSLQPSAAVQAMVDGEDVGRVRATTGVLLEVSLLGWGTPNNLEPRVLPHHAPMPSSSPRASLPPSPLPSLFPLRFLSYSSLQDPKVSGATAAAASCPNAKLLPTCLIRNLTSLFLRHPSLDFTLAAASPPLPARSVASAFHPNRAPLLPHTAAWRVEHCGDGGAGSADIATACYQRLVRPFLHSTLTAPPAAAWRGGQCREGGSADIATPCYQRLVSACLQASVHPNRAPRLPRCMAGRALWGQRECRYRHSLQPKTASRAIPACRRPFTHFHAQVARRLLRCGARVNPAIPRLSRGTQALPPSSPSLPPSSPSLPPSSPSLPPSSPSLPPSSPSLPPSPPPQPPPASRAFSACRRPFAHLHSQVARLLIRCGARVNPAIPRLSRGTQALPPSSPSLPPSSPSLPPSSPSLPPSSPSLPPSSPSLPPSSPSLPPSPPPQPPPASRAFSACRRPFAHLHSQVARLLIRCGARLAELFLLADAPSLIFTHKSPAFTFVVARGSTRQSRGLEGAFRVVQPALCAAACPKPLLENKFAQHMIVDESLKVLYCALPKVGNTSWKLWFRLMKLRGNYSEFHSFNKTSSDNNAGSSANGTAAADAGVGGTAAAEGTAAPAAAAAASEPAAINITTEDFKMIHLRGLNGLTELPDLHEEAAIRFITRRDVFRFTFVRNPLTRATSAFLDKFVHARNFTNEGDARLYWADAMFGQTKQLKKMLKEHPTSEFSFAEYLVLVEEALKGDADTIENHIDKQIDLCALDRVHYDFVGRFENMSADVAAVMRQLNTSDLGIFQKGKSLQLTGADQRSAQLYDKDSLERANRIYSDDMSIPFNAIRYDIPEALKQVAARENGTQTPATATSRKLLILESPR